MSDVTNQHIMSDSEKSQEDWMNRRWRPLMGYMYLVVCLCDFVVFPVLWSIHLSMVHGNVATQWDPITLRGAGLFHLAMGAILGIAAYGRTQEKMAGVNSYHPGPNTQNGYGYTQNGYSRQEPCAPQYAPRAYAKPIPQQDHQVL